MLIVIFVVNDGHSGVPVEASIASSSFSLHLGRHRQALIPTGSPQCSQPRMRAVSHIHMLFHLHMLKELIE
jgi:hypothetical protein